MTNPQQQHTHHHHGQKLTKNQRKIHIRTHWKSNPLEPIFATITTPEPKPNITAPNTATVRHTTTEPSHNHTYATTSPSQPKPPCHYNPPRSRPITPLPPTNPKLTPTQIKTLHPHHQTTSQTTTEPRSTHTTNHHKPRSTRTINPNQPIPQT